jgi:Uma2 family endonuclease
MAVGLRYTIKQFDEFIQLPSNADKSFEFIGGEIVEVVSNSYCSEIAANIMIELGGFVKRNKLGRMTSADGGYIVSGEKYIPDIAFISLARQPEPSHETYNPNPPDLVVEVVSPTDQEKNLLIKVANYLAAGTRVWVVRPDSQVIEDYTPGKPVKVTGNEGTISGGSILPGFVLAVKDIFPE